MEVSKLRAGSRGLRGTLQNIQHHAPLARPTVKRLVDLVTTLDKEIAHWRQAHNVHIIETKDGRQICFRPYTTISLDLGVTGVEVLLKISRKLEVKLMIVETIQEYAIFVQFMTEFLRVKKNYYGMSKAEAAAEE